MLTLAIGRTRDGRCICRRRRDASIVLAVMHMPPSSSSRASLRSSYLLPFCSHLFVFDLTSAFVPLVDGAYLRKCARCVPPYMRSVRLLCVRACLADLLAGFFFASRFNRVGILLGSLVDISGLPSPLVYSSSNSGLRSFVCCHVVILAGLPSSTHTLSPIRELHRSSLTRSIQRASTPLAMKADAKIAVDYSAYAVRSD